MRIETSRLVLRLLGPGDAALYDALYGDADTMRQVGTALAPGRLARSFATACRANAVSPPRRRTWVIHTLGAADDVGLIGLVWDGASDDTAVGAGVSAAELGVMLPPAWQGRGLATEAIAALCPVAFADLGLDAVHTWHADGHALAAGLMRRAGFAPLPARPGESGQRWRRERDDGPVG